MDLGRPARSEDVYYLLLLSGQDATPEISPPHGRGLVCDSGDWTAKLPTMAVVNDVRIQVGVPQ